LILTFLTLLVIFVVAVPTEFIASRLGYAKYANEILLVAIVVGSMAGRFLGKRSFALALIARSFRGSLNRYWEALYREDIPAMRREMGSVVSSLRSIGKKKTQAIAQLYEAILLVDTECFQDAAPMLAAIPRDALPESFHWDLLFRLAWCKTNLGEFDEAMLLAREALDLAGKKSSYQPISQCLLGSALFYAGRFEKALAPLSKGLEGELAPYNRACAEHYLGLSLERLSRWEEARAAFERSIDALECKWARRSRERLSEAESDPRSQA
jgi:tetratricopeptide (TPR) repeat protein